MSTIEPTFEPLVCLAPRVTTGSFDAVRVILDGCVLDGRDSDLLEFVGRFKGDIQMTSLPEVVAELGRGWDGKKRLRLWNKIMRRKQSTKVNEEDVLPRSEPMVYGDNCAPTLGPHMRGDLAIRIQLSVVIAMLERTLRGKRVMVLFVTQDYGCCELMRAVGTASAEYRCLRVDVEETGVIFQNILYDQTR
jgi:hypothetical protein